MKIDNNLRVGKLFTGKQLKSLDCEVEDKDLEVWFVVIGDCDEIIRIG